MPAEVHFGTFIAALVAVLEYGMGGDPKYFEPIEPNQMENLPTMELFWFSRRFLLALVLSPYIFPPLSVKQRGQQYRACFDPFREMLRLLRPPLATQQLSGSVKRPATACIRNERRRLSTAAEPTKPSPAEAEPGWPMKVLVRRH